MALWKDPSKPTPFPPPEAVPPPKSELPPFVELARAGERQRMRGDGAARGEELGWRHQNFPSRFWKPVGLLRSGSPALSQSAVHSMSSAGVIPG